MAKDQMKREPEWTEAIAAGIEQLMERIEPLIRNRREIRAGCLENGSGFCKRLFRTMGQFRCQKNEL